MLLLARYARSAAIKVLIEPINNPLGVGPGKGNQGTTRGKEKLFGLGENRTQDLQLL